MAEYVKWDLNDPAEDMGDSSIIEVAISFG